jgi:hypothetical protein
VYLCGQRENPLELHIFTTPMRTTLRLLIPALALLVAAGCTNSSSPDGQITDTSSPFLRTAGYSATRSTLDNSVMDACLAAEMSVTHWPGADSIGWITSAAFAPLAKVGSVSFAGHDVPFDAVSTLNTYFSIEHGTLPNTRWIVKDYAGTNLDTSIVVAQEIRLRGYFIGDSISRSTGRTFTYDGADRRDSLVCGFAYGNFAFPDTSDRNQRWFGVPDSGSFTITPELLKQIPLNSFSLTLDHDGISYKTDAAGHKIGFYSDFKSSYTFRITK